MTLSSRITRRVSRDYAEQDRQAVEEVLLGVVDGRGVGSDGAERIVAAVLLHAAGDVDQLLAMANLAQVDFRDVLMGSGLEHGDWAARLDAEFGD
ncbi:hypothetical protein [Streptomyces lincolnensis]|uniref:hypothetical protein n=1 Tax=Streptomyces lincolnensis TaxID=1915 RepID=UPI000832E3A7|nr:hypothetical protein [Streptomyces lincolnensis]QMV09273.1 hypothetical protein GJU35_28910 [Streptomyces lincolnensis]